MASLPLVIILGATGRTGQSIADALLDSGKFRVGAITRPGSISKPEVEALRAKGVEIRATDPSSDSLEKLKEALSGAEVLISAVSATAIDGQKTIIAAAKEVGVKRVVPCDFGTPGRRGVRALHDAKLDIREYVQKLGIGYTFIDIGWWMQLTVTGTTAHPSLLGPWSEQVFDSGRKKQLLTNVDHVGPFVARIVADPRTLNHYVIVWEEEMTFTEAKDISERYSGECEALRAKRKLVSREELLKLAEDGKTQYAKTHDDASHATWAYAEYMLSLHFIGENTLENAKALGALDARELYPDAQFTSFEDFSKKFYA
ncbi:uncharacterized protein FIBRA_06340 [Fibroporia radiculosa]|uniref:NmrA-like domain-containing protein n=1 Tax=Fibroporia radiculosa TaxID=599839 RepID=J4GB72_9APHY|nr:uncharacterized protein FIBRA_06340 [Fibroporia radiculosa]CCM04178.1 predicted protein [Fibroporia radiculosa]